MKTSTEMNAPNKGSKLRARICYACGTFGHDVFYAMLATYFMIFVTSNLFNFPDAGYNAKMIGLVTTIILVLRIGELFIDPFIGNTIDKTNTRWGKFKPWVLGGAFVAAISLTLLFTDLGGLTSQPVIYLVAFTALYLIMDIFYSAKDVAIWSMIPAISFDSREREITATFARIGSVFGQQLVSVMVIPIVLYFSLDANGGAGDANGWFAFALIGGGIATLGAIILALGTKEQKSALRENKTDTSFKQVFSVLIHNDQLLWIAVTYLVFGLGQYLVNNFNLYYFIYVLGDATKFPILGVINVIIGLVAVACFPALTSKFKRRKLFFYSTALMVLSLALYAVAGQNLTLVLIAAGLFSLPQPLIFLVVLMTITDTVEYGQLKLGHRDEALVLCVRPLVDKLSGAITSGVIGLTAIAVGMTGKATAASISAGDVMTFKLIMFAVPIALIIVATVMFKKKVTLDEAQHAAIVRELEENWDSINK